MRYNLLLFPFGTFHAATMCGSINFLTGWGWGGGGGGGMEGIWSSTYFTGGSNCLSRGVHTSILIETGALLFNWAQFILQFIMPDCKSLIFWLLNDVPTPPVSFSLRLNNHLKAMLFGLLRIPIW